MASLAVTRVLPLKALSCVLSCLEPTSHLNSFSMQHNRRNAHCRIMAAKSRLKDTSTTSLVLIKLREKAKNQALRLAHPSLPVCLLARSCGIASRRPLQKRIGHECQPLCSCRPLVCPGLVMFTFSFSFPQCRHAAPFWKGGSRHVGPVKKGEASRSEVSKKPGLFGLRKEKFP